MKKKYRTLILTLSLMIGGTTLIGILISKNQGPKELCEDYTEKIAKGNPTFIRRWNQECKDVQAAITPEICRQAFQVLILQGTRSAVVERFGQEAMRCFSKRDLKNFLVK